VADKGLKKSLYTSARLKKGEVIYLETHFNRYELFPLFFLVLMIHSLLLWTLFAFHVGLSFHGTHCPFNFVTSFHRYELCFNGDKPRSIGLISNASDAEPEKHQNSSHHSQNGDRVSVDHELRDVFRWSRCKKAMPESAMRSIGIPLPADQLEVFLASFVRLKIVLAGRDTNIAICFPGDVAGVAG